MNTASRKAISRNDCRDAGGRVTHGAVTEAHLAGKGGSLFKRCNTADDGFPARPKGAYQSVQHGVTTLANGTTIACGLCLVLNALVSSVSIKPTLLEY